MPLHNRASQPCCSLLLIGLLVTGFTAAPAGDIPPARTMSRNTFTDKVKGAWAGQAIGVTMGTPFEFRYNSARVPDSVNVPWTPGMMEKTYTEIPGAYDDIYVDLTFLDTYRKNPRSSARDYATAFAGSRYWLWCANQMGRNNVRQGIMPPHSGHWLRNPECTSIDFEIGADWIGLVHPGLRAEALALADSIGHITTYGDGYYGGVFVSQMYAAAFLTDSVEAIVAAGLASIPPQSQFHHMINDVVQYHRLHPSDWRGCWQLINDRYANENGSPSGVMDPFNIEASMNAAHVATGLLFGNGDFTSSMEIAIRCGDDADCTPGTCAGILGLINGYEGIPETYRSQIPDVESRKFQSSAYSLRDAIEATTELALANIAATGGSVSDEAVVIKGTLAPMSPLEIARPSHLPYARVDLWQRVPRNDIRAKAFMTTLPPQRKAQILSWSDSIWLPTDLFDRPYSLTFMGNGFAIAGEVVSDSAGDMNFESRATYALMSIDSRPPERVRFPLNFHDRRVLAFFDFTLPEGLHTVSVATEDRRIPGYRFNLREAILYSGKRK